MADESERRNVGQAERAFVERVSDEASLAAKRDAVFASLAYEGRRSA